MMPNRALISLGLLCSLAFTGCATNPITGQSELMLIPEEQDIAIGRQYAPEVTRQMGGKIAQQELQNYINSVGQRIDAVCQKPGWQYQYIALNDKTANAFALPGGYVFITKGMLEKLSSEAQLAAILSHETAHIVARHSSAQMSRQIGIEILLSAVTSESTSEGVLTAANLGSQIIGLGYSREQESQADLAGIEYMVKAGYNPYGMLETMQMLQEQNAVRPMEFFSTHPSPENRIAEIYEYILQKYPNISGGKVGAEDYRKYVLTKLN
jgi:predicted Zn-dependent protease